MGHLFIGDSMKVNLNGEIVNLPQSEVEELIDLGYISGSIEEYQQSGSIPNYEDEYTPAREALACMYVEPPKPVFNPEDYEIEF